MFYARRLTHVIFAALFLAVFWTGCDFIEQQEDADPDDPAGPGGDPPAAVVDVTKTVGAQGGQLEVDGMEFKLPAGALTSDASLTLARVSEVPDILRDEAVTGSFTVTGLPDDFGGPIELVLSIEGNSRRLELCRGRDRGLRPVTR